MGGKAINTSATKLEALTIQSSCYGGPIAWLRGMNRVPGNLIWYGDFKAISHTQKAGGKGGGGSSTTYSYTASLAVGLCHGQVVDIPRVWKGKSTTTLGALSLTLNGGAVGQAQWSVLAGRGSETLNYSGLAFVGARGYDLGDSASIENHAFEVRHSSAYQVSPATPDVNLGTAAYELLTHPTQGAAFPAALIGDWTAWYDYCSASGLLGSPLLTAQVAAAEALQTMADLTNAAIFWSEGKLKVKPYGDEALTGNGRTYTPDTTPVYQLNDSCYIARDGEAPVSLALKTPADRYNIVKVQYLDRANGYNPAVVTARDLTDISVNGPRPMDQISADWICEATVARLVAELRKQRALLVQGEYTFSLPWHYALLEVMDLVTIADSVLMLEDVPARVVSIVEESDEELTITCEDYPAGVASAPRYPAQAPAGYALNANVSPGSALAPLIFELPGALTGSGLELGIATAGGDANWGGCQVWVSYDGTTYKQLTELRQASRYGVLTADGVDAGTLGLTVNAGQQLLSGSAADVASLATLTYLAPFGGAPGEYVAYQDATLTGPGAYTLSGVSRGAYGTTPTLHGAGTPWVRVDDAIARTGDLDPALVGKTVYVKLLSFNVFGAAVQGLADVSPTAYVISGRHLVRKGATLAIKINTSDFSGALNYNECYLHGRNSSGAPIDAPGTVLVNGAPVAVPNGLLYGSRAGSCWIVWDSSGAGFPIDGGPSNYPYVAARKTAGGWQYDNNNGWAAFTPSSAHYVIGTVEAGGPDTGSPGTPPGITAASIWAAASTLDALGSLADAGFAAQSAATAAAASASTALSQLATMRSNGYLDASEKPAIIRQWTAIANEKAGIVAQANALGIVAERDAYSAAVSALDAYLSSLWPGWSDTTQDTPITPAIDQAKWLDVYNTRQALLNKIAAVAATLASWSGVSGAGKPQDNATNGATFGINISGQASTSDIGSTAVTELASFIGSAYYNNTV